MASPRPTPEAVRLSAAVDAAGQRLAVLRAEVQRAETAEALIRLQLGEALAEALGARSLAEARLRASQFDRYRAAAFAHRGPDRRNRLRRLAEKVLARLGAPGRTLVRARARLGEGAALFDPDWYAAQAPEPVGADPLAHYLVWGGDARLSPHPLFDSRFYADRNAAELARTGLTPLDHFLREGAAEGRDPHPLFSLEGYVAQAPELAATGENPVLHYLRTGAARGLSPHPLFDPEWAGGDLVWYLTEGWRTGASPHPLFDPAWRREQGLDDGESEPLARFVLTARDTLESPGPYFNSRTYAEARGAAMDPSKDPLSDYLAGGAWAVLGPEGLHPALALLDDPEAIRSGMTPAEALARRSRGSMTSVLDSR
ncbi:hypothetical protein [Phenylobacterium sp.]|uniref:hypothetical protein n=1 Tax=Phenylobacterium sp. TaxID=1871053 RepID=UPI0025D9CC8E|nr:hypothetical protein [Phenylobacterium sp.]MCA3721043.1 hypothetical protein [Phenylobacterium sp.]